MPRRTIHTLLQDCLALLSPAPRTLPGVLPYPLPGTPPPSLLPSFPGPAHPLDFGPTSSRNPLYLPELTSSWGLQSVPHDFAQLTGFFEDCFRVRLQNRDCECPPAAECDLLEGKGGTLRGLQWERTFVSLVGPDPKSTAAQRGGAQLRELLRSHVAAPPSCPAPRFPLPPPPSPCGAGLTRVAGKMLPPPPSCCTSVPRQSQLLILPFV